MSDDERWETVAWEMLDLTRMLLPLGDGPNRGWAADVVPKRYVGLAWWIYAELRDFPTRHTGPRPRHQTGKAVARTPRAGVRHRRHHRLTAELS